MTGLIGKMFTWAKSVLLERGHLVYWLNIPAFLSTIEGAENYDTIILP